MSKSASCPKFNPTNKPQQSPHPQSPTPTSTTPKNCPKNSASLSPELPTANTADPASAQAGHPPPKPASSAT